MTERTALPPTAPNEKGRLPHHINEHLQQAQTKALDFSQRRHYQDGFTPTDLASYSGLLQREAQQSEWRGQQGRNSDNLSLNYGVEEPTAARTFCRGFRGRTAASLESRMDRPTRILEL